MIPIALRQAPKSNFRWLIAACAAALFALRAEPSSAAQYADALPWDQTLDALEDILVGPVAHTVITVNFVFSAILYVIGNHQRASRFLAGGLAAYAALIAVHLLTFLSPF
ncbi:TrbC/VirB2 family protein [Candidatus Binatus sp.]|uniref:TrbC/VirB2 family protein n=1 Tax=Candidatus Binatus sp. TaxID=2811406 RepID=UPI003CBDC12F